MPTNRITMRQIRQARRLHLEAGLSYAQVVRAVGIGKGTVGKFILLARDAGVDWSVTQTLTDEELEARLYRPAVPRASRHLEPDYAWIHQELKRPGVTLQLLWEAYQRGGEQAYKYTSFCVKYRAWSAALKRSMRQMHVAGERLCVDYAGQTVPVIPADRSARATMAHVHAPLHSETARSNQATAREHEAAVDHPPGRLVCNGAVLEASTRVAGQRANLDADPAAARPCEHTSRAPGSSGGSVAASVWDGPAAHRT